LTRADRVLRGAEPPYSDAQVREWAVLVALGADALVAAGCADGDDGLADLLEASLCYLAAAPDPRSGLSGGELYAKAAAALRSIAERRTPAP
jgi:hypothetical protein